MNRILRITKQGVVNFLTVLKDKNQLSDEEPQDELTAELVLIIYMSLTRARILTKQNIQARRQKSTDALFQVFLFHSLGHEAKKYVKGVLSFIIISKTSLRYMLKYSEQN